MSNTEVRLIDANSFKRFLQALCKAGAPYHEVIQLLDKEPTANSDDRELSEELEQYRAIGTLEECQAAVEKMKPKKVVIKNRMPYCPCCGTKATTDTGDSFVDYGLDYCNECGQKIDWEGGAE